MFNCVVCLVQKVWVFMCVCGCVWVCCCFTLWKSHFCLVPRTALFSTCLFFVLDSSVWHLQSLKMFRSIRTLLPKTHSAELIRCYFNWNDLTDNKPKWSFSDWINQNQLWKMNHSVKIFDGLSSENLCADNFDVYLFPYTWLVVVVVVVNCPAIEIKSFSSISFHLSWNFTVGNPLAFTALELVKFLSFRDG